MRHEAPYFLPKLMPEREKIETIRILKQESRSAAAIAELRGIAETIPNQSMLINAVVLQEAKDSSEIENIVTTQDKLYKALNVHSGKIDPRTKEVVNYREALFLGFDIIKEQGFMKVNDIIKIQQQLEANRAGIRAVPGTVLKNDRTDETIYTPPQSKEEILDLMDNFIQHYNMNENDISPLIMMTVLHAQFESIHPFYDGNGRTGRILNLLYLIMNRLLNVPILYHSSYIIENKSEYYKTLNKINNDQNWEDFILFMLKSIEETSKMTIKKIRQIRDLLDKSIEKVQKEAASIYKKELVELLFEQPYCKIGYLVENLGVERKAASRYLRELETIDLLTSSKIGREKIYINHALMKILKS
ncbi:MAG: Fic family protein [Candidatus Marinimicrobia bacterium]|nr:Fic family protein [Candidatus Neomarinimicrobiota bacterium]